MTRRVTAPLAAMPWWCSPAGITLGFLIPTIGLIAMAGESQSSMLTVRGVRFLDLESMLLGMLMLVPIALGGWVGAQVQSSRAQLGDTDSRPWDRTALVMGSIALLGYSFLLKEFLLSPALLWGTLTGAVKLSRQELGGSAGVSSLVNMAQVFFAIYAFRLVDGTARPIPRGMHLLIGMLATMTMFRVYVFSERLSMMEISVPFGLAMGRWLSAQRSPRWAVLRNLGPFAALPVVILYFGVAEYARSWSSATYQGKTSFWEFAIGRFISYYVTSLNNGAGVVATTPEPTWKYEHTLEWLHRAPFGLGARFSEYIGFNAEAKSSFIWYLRVYGDPEFNSNSGLFVPMADLGVFGALLYMLAIGLVGGLSFRAYRAGRLGGVLFLPLLFITFLEVFRYPFLAQPRAFTWTIGIFVALGVVRFMEASNAAERARQRIDPRVGSAGDSPRRRPASGSAAASTAVLEA